jgi:hypothetical protein
MALRVRLVHFAGESLGVVVERLLDGKFFDPDSAAFVDAAPAKLMPLGAAAREGPWAGVYRAFLDTPAATWADGQYAVYVLNEVDGRIVAGPFAATIYKGDDAPALPIPWPTRATVAWTS